MSPPTRTPTKPCTAFFASASVAVSSGAAASLVAIPVGLASFKLVFSFSGEISNVSASLFSSVFSTGFTFTFNSISFVDPSENIIVAFTVFSPASFVSTGATSSSASCGRFVIASF